jgi:GntR family transcriptional regulator
MTSTSVFTRPNPASGVPIYLQLVRQVYHAVDTGALRAGDQLPGIRALAEALVVNPNTVAKAYRELEHEGVLDLRQGAGAFVTARVVGAADGRVRGAEPLVAELLDTLTAADLEEDEIRRLFEAELTRRFGIGPRIGHATRAG